MVLQSKIETNSKHSLKKVLGPVVQVVDNSIHWVNLYPFDNALSVSLAALQKRDESRVNDATKTTSWPDRWHNITVIIQLTALGNY